MSPGLFVSGGTRGIGRAIVERFHQAGWRVGTCARSPEAVARLAVELPGVQTWTADLSQREAALRLVDEVSKSLGPLDVLVNNAGVFAPDDLATLDLAAFDRMMATNLGSALLLCQGLVPAMRARGQGTVVHIGSIAGLRGYPTGLSYCVSKHAMLGLARAMREELKPEGVRVVSVLPGATFTDSWAGAALDEDRLMPPEDVAEVVWTACTASHRTVIEEIVLRPQLGDI